MAKFSRAIDRLVRLLMSRKFVIRCIGQFQVEKIRGSKTEIANVWLGDSHASFNSGIPLRDLLRRSGTDALIWLGPRLMFSISKDGFPDFLFKPRYKNLMKGNRKLLVSFGEIDIRVHLSRESSKVQKFEWVGSYVEAVSELLNFWNPSVVFILGPVPPSGGMVDSQFPVNETLALRIEGTNLMNEKLATQTSNNPKIRFVSLSSLLGDNEGLLLSKFYQDGVHASGNSRLEIQNFINKSK